MLRHLHIQNYALITHLDIDFTAGLTVLTGETGAGKSIILGALGLVMGGRADTKAISEGCDKCIIEATFDDAIVRRELYATGKSRSFIDDSLAGLAELKTFATKSIDIHSQHENLLLEDDAFQLSIVDALAQNEAQRDDYIQKYNTFLAIQKELADLQQLATKSKEDQDYLTYQYNELDTAQLRAGEVVELESEATRLRHIQETKEGITTAYKCLDNEDEQRGSVLTLLCEATHFIEKVTDFLPDKESVLPRLNSCYADLKDIKDTLMRLNADIEEAPERLAEIEERLDTLYHLLKKHHVETDTELIGVRDKMKEQLQQITSFDERISTLKQSLTVAEGELKHSAEVLTQTRVGTRQLICESLKANLIKLGIPHANMDIQITPCEYTPSGADNIQFLFAANLNQTLQPIKSIASGGELSRIMLCIKALVATTKGLPTIIFDEIDTGVSGEIANQMGLLMQQMATTRQIITITHLPQIACRGQQHYKVFKSDTSSRTETNICVLSQDERIEEIATMLSGVPPTQEAIANAKQLLLCRKN